MRSKISITLAVVLGLILSGCTTIKITEYEQGCRDGATYVVRSHSDEPNPAGINALCKSLNDADQTKVTKGERK